MATTPPTITITTTTAAAMTSFLAEPVFTMGVAVEGRRCPAPTPACWFSLPAVAPAADTAPPRWHSGGRTLHDPHNGVVSMTTVFTGQGQS
ncbi:hypothetical protein PG997_001987 [Apiospora hydei]|uniref:Uncharacterized protein n=1 Tax=Apiospora hydei TaxID=1337664 RepID=A0ABR1X820_9PEZI